MINKIMLDSRWTCYTKTELAKLNNNKVFNESSLFENITYLNDAETVIRTLQDKYRNDDTFVSYLVAFTVIISNIPSSGSEYLQITAFPKKLSKQSQYKRDEGTVDDPDTIIDLSDRNQVLKNNKI